MSTDIKKQASELTGLSKLLFDRGVYLWYSALVIEIIAGILAVGVSLCDLDRSWSIFLATIGLMLLVGAYCLKIRFAVVYDNAETMRRQAVFSNALGWPISRNQFSEWRLLSGKKIISQLDKQEVDPNYFATQETIGPVRLLEMTQESAFWTRHLYCYLRTYVWILFVVVCLIFSLVLIFSATDFAPKSIELNLVFIITQLVPLVLTVDLLGWGIKLNKLIKSIGQIESDLERLDSTTTSFEHEVLRLVAEYNCQVVSGFPTPSWFFNKHHDQIQSLWNRR